ncbi:MULTISPECIES: outer membrane lipoprotein carrier protein LolA [Neisseria]|uniref:Outer membrane lipocarrier LolA family protein n=1 Tax=Neisseria musculi TaxID=1815583 RepID=A0A7H1M8C1_9NEIS|nr:MULTISPECIES: outer membrane lipoprotein carrier protein LolA [Neisseria]MBF0804401.1 outer membrane lipoprotein carrier protein LolA [Neisseria sp. 19428wB4_WF04]QNT57886.1 outer membrane lipocarrier LolA family protein [Neisseria musculi]TFU42829.1 outer membrane lipoprotein carrier protein LolA [Neisseria sp. WF04]
MKKLLFTAALTLASPLLWAFTAADLAQMLQKPANVQGAFVQERRLKSLSKPMIAEGRFVLVPQKGLLWHMQKPFDNRLRIRADGIMQWNGRNWAADGGKMSGRSRQTGLLLDLLGGNIQGLEQHFELKLNGTPQKWTLRLTPKTVLMKQIFNHIDISGGSVVQRVELHEKQGDVMVMRFERVQAGRDLDEFARQAL